ncbi:MAG: hypothetical protein IPL46_27665 [Saprospiraceae bacterium]|nr:hypothetical protein [Saprospiraceae bacterium]
MRSSAFFKWLTFLSVLLTVVILSISTFEIFAGIKPISFGSLFFFITLSIVVFYLGNAAASHKNKNRLTQLIMILVFFKLFSCLLIIVIYDRLFHPSSDFYVLPFFLIYIVFTVFEVMMLSKANKMLDQPK